MKMTNVALKNSWNKLYCNVLFQFIYYYLFMYLHSIDSNTTEMFPGPET